MSKVELSSPSRLRVTGPPMSQFNSSSTSPPISTQSSPKIPPAPPPPIISKPSPTPLKLSSDLVLVTGPPFKNSLISPPPQPKPFCPVGVHTPPPPPFKTGPSPHGTPKPGTSQFLSSEIQPKTKRSGFTFDFYPI